MGTEVRNVQNLKEVLDLALAGVKLVSDAQKDGHIGVEDLGLILNLIPVVGPAFDKIGEVPAEIGDLSSEEAAELAGYVMAKLTLSDEKARKVIDASFKLLSAGLAMMAAFKTAPAAPAKA
jgi:hypothetical protein